MKKHNFRKNLLILILLFVGTFSFAQTGVQVQFISGSTAQNYTVEDTGKLYFSGDNLLIQTSSTASDVTIPISIIQKVIFTDEALATNEVGANVTKLTLYPNPSSDYIQIKSPSKEKLNVQIYSVSGQLVMKGSYASQESIDVTKLKAGLYLVQANGTTIKFIKK